MSQMYPLQSVEFYQRAVTRAQTEITTLSQRIAVLSQEERMNTIRMFEAECAAKGIFVNTPVMITAPWGTAPEHGKIVRFNAAEGMVDYETLLDDGVSYSKNCLMWTDVGDTYSITFEKE